MRVATPLRHDDENTDGSGVVHTTQASQEWSAAVPGRIEIDDVQPVVSCGTYPAKAVVGEVVPVYLAAKVTEVGTLQLEEVARDGDERWKVEFDVRAGDGTPLPEGDEQAPEQPVLGV